VSAIASLLEVLGTSVKGPLMERLIADHALIGPNDDGYWENSRAGISLLAEDGLVDTIFLHAFGKDDFMEFPGPLPAGLTFESRRTDVRHAFGTPESSGGPDKVTNVYSHDGWDRYAVGARFIHFSYRRNDGRIDLVTLMRKAVG